jgi:hypothetical protein
MQSCERQCGHPPRQQPDRRQQQQPERQFERRDDESGAGPRLPGGRTASRRRGPGSTSGYLGRSGCWRVPGHLAVRLCRSLFRACRQTIPTLRPAKDVTALSGPIRVEGDELNYTLRLGAVGHPLQHHLAAMLRKKSEGSADSSRHPTSSGTATPFTRPLDGSATPCGSAGPRVARRTSPDPRACHLQREGLYRTAIRRFR